MVAGALVLVSVVLYPAVGANLRGQIDNALAAAAAQAPDVAAYIKAQNVPPDGRHRRHRLFPPIPMGIGTTQLQIVPSDAVRVGPSAQFVDVTARDVAVAQRRRRRRTSATRRTAASPTASTPRRSPGQPGIARAHRHPGVRPGSDAAHELAWLLAASTVAAGLLAALAARLAARRVLRPVRPAHRDRRAASARPAT